MKLSEYFEKTKGRGIMATSDSKGKVGKLSMEDLISLMKKP